MARRIHTYHDKRWAKWFYYDETSPSCLRWAISPARYVRVGAVAGNPTTRNKYMQVSLTIDGVTHSYSVHRIVFQLNYPSVVVEEVDHEDQNSHNNKIGNLRGATPITNAQNKSKHSNNQSGVSGVSLRKYVSGEEYWVAQWQVAGTGRPSGKAFSIARFGNDAAFQMACAYRDLQIAKLNEAGANYTEGHGK